MAPARRGLARLWAVLALAWLAVASALGQAQRTHIVQAGQTLYSIANKYAVTREDILAANPAIADVTAIPTGYVLTIPEPGYAETHRVGDEAAASLRASMSGALPISSGQSAPSHVGIATPAYPSASYYRKGTNEIILTVVMPFNLGATDTESLKLQKRSVEFYQGLLMAVDEMQQRGRYVTVAAYDLSTTPMAEIQASDVVRQSDLIVAPFELSDVRQLAAFGDEYCIPVLSPFAYSADLVGRYKNLVQLNTPKAQLYPQLCDDLAQRFAGYTFVFLTDSLAADRPEGLVAPLRQKLAERQMPALDFAFGHDALPLERVDSLLGISGERVVYVPVTAQKATLQRLFPALKNQLEAQRDDVGHVVIPLAPTVSDHVLLGYPEWQLLTGDMINYFYDLNVYMFSKIYVNPFEADVKDFFSTFKYWYQRDLMNTIPRYGILGYDVARFFLSAIHDRGVGYVARLPEQRTHTLQTVMRYEHGAEGGYVNRGLYLVHFTTDSKIEKYVVE